MHGRAGRLPADVQIALYRLAQESLANVLKHARASSASVCLHVDADGLTLLIEDDGRGFDPSAPRPGHLGLAVMTERAAAIGASLEVDSRPGEGTRVRIVWPSLVT